MINKQTKKTKVKNIKTTVKPDIQSDDCFPVWVFSRIDRNGQFAFDIRRKDFDHYEVLDKMISYSSIKWKQLKLQTHDDGRSKHHYLELTRLSKEAQIRIKAMHLEEEVDLLFSMSLKNKLRIIGIRDKEKFYVLWYDPEHKVCPSTKKHT